MGSKKRPLSVEQETKGNLVALGFVLNYRRKRLGLTVEEVARRARMKPERLVAIEAGGDEKLDFLLIVRLASALQADTGAVLNAAERHIRGKSRKGGIAKKRRKRAPRTGTR
jgi:transcriptional regulator with XRE-family HTH domain